MPCDHPPPASGGPELLPAPWTAEDVAASLREAFITLHNLPATGCYPGGLPDSIAEFLAELDTAGRLKPKIPPTAAAIARLDRVLPWLTWLSTPERLCVSMVARGLSYRAAAVALKRRGESVSHKTVERRWHAALDHIAGRLNRTRYVHI